MNEFEIKEINKNNFLSVWPLIQECLISYGDNNHLAESKKEFFLKLVNGEFEGAQHVCNLNGRPTGFSTLYFTYSSFYAQKIAHLNDLYVTEEHRRCGVGSRFLDNIQKYVKSKNLKIVQWLVGPENLAAQKFYESVPTIKSRWIRHTWKI